VRIDMIKNPRAPVEASQGSRLRERSSPFLSREFLTESDGKPFWSTV
jgi:hypothetical protein